MNTRPMKQEFKFTNPVMKITGLLMPGAFKSKRKNI